jgi:hypothetical protein
MEENSMIYSKLENGIIVNKVSASEQPDGYVLDTSNSHIGERRDFFDNNWNRKSLSVLVTEKLIDIPDGYKLENESFVEMTDEEKITAGIIKPTEREKIADGKIVSKTTKELYDDKIITAKEYNEYIDTCRKSEYVATTDSIFWDYQEDKATKTDWEKAKQAIRDKYPKVEE